MNTKRRFSGKLRVFPSGLRRALGDQTTLASRFGVELNAGRGPDHIRVFTGFVLNLDKFLTTTRQ